MKDPRISALADVLIQHSCQLQAGEKILIEAFDLPESNLVCELVEKARAVGGLPVVSWKSNEILRSLYASGDKASLQLVGELEANVMQQMDAYIGIRGAANSDQFADVPGEQMDLMTESIWQPVHIDIRVPKTKWVVLRYPTHSMAQSARMSTAAFEDFFFDVCTADYAAMGVAQEPLKELMLATDEVHIKSPGTDLKFSIKEIPVVPCSGGRNIPDGEVFTAPVRDSLNGVIQYNAGSRYQGTVFENIRFEFKDGKIIDATCTGQTERLNEILDTDPGARYIGEWSLGCNNRVKHPMMDTLFDEKIGGSMHLTPGNAYDSADNGNRSRVHWDLVLIQTPEYGGGEIWFDGKLIRENGRFLPENLQPLNVGLG
ncbi:aminopeptidase [Thalassoglobus polymorphus]|uniref:Aminopeptidase PepS n=1 Tax=Thalassoglobus polymorphus TaxID=2527994 RepID=A0A517QK76_9PLAN|nr:aminopeptidase [Thalassoglobus polymorphus]QDT32050.1 Aminopeptidase PepS [Thalassoglobus polymorphus]